MDKKGRTGWLLVPSQPLDKVLDSEEAAVESDWISGIPKETVGIHSSSRNGRDQHDKDDLILDYWNLSP